MADFSNYRGQALDTMDQMTSIFELLSQHGSMKGEVASMRGKVEKLREHLHDEKLTVAVLALTKSGKTEANVVMSIFLPALYCLSWLR